MNARERVVDGKACFLQRRDVIGTILLGVYQHEIGRKVDLNELDDRDFRRKYWVPLSAEELRASSAVRHLDKRQPQAMSVSRTPACAL